MNELPKKLQHRVAEFIQYEEALRKSEEHFRSLIENSLDIIGILDPFGNILYMNPAVKEILGYRPEEVIGDNIFSLLHPEDLNTFLVARDETVYREGESRYIQARLRHKDGSWKTLEMVGRSFLDNNGEMKLIVNSRDMTARRAAEEKLFLLNKELEMYAHTVSHDLRSPLTAIKTAGETLQSLCSKRDQLENVDASIIRISDIINLSVGQAEDLITDLLSLAMSMQQPDTVSEIDVGEMVEKIVKERTPILKQKNADVLFDKEMGSIKANKTQIYQVFGNLIDNAINHNDKPNPLVEILYRGNINGKHTFAVQDNGPGIRPEDTEKIFLPFSKGKNGHSGMGLAIVDKTVKLYGGDIKVENINGGACFTFQLCDYEDITDSDELEDGDQ